MPLVARAAACWAAGLAIGLLAPTRLVLVAVAGALLLALLSVRTRGTVGALAVVAAAAMLAAMADDAHTARCIAVLGAAREWQVELASPARAGGVAHGVFSGGGCETGGTMAIVSGSAEAGMQASVRGSASADARGMFVRSARVTGARSVRSLAGLRAGAAMRVDRIFGTDAPVVRALVIGDMSLIPAAQRDRFARAGLVHMLSVSGLHVAVIALALELLAGALRVPRRPARVVSMVMLGAYVAGIGAPPPAVRAAVMLALFIVSRSLQRPTSPWAVVALGSVAPLVAPRTVLDLGWQLSVAGTVALVAGGSLARRSIPSGWPGGVRSTARAAVVSIVATVVTAPLVAWTFGRVALLGPVTNLLADPIMGVLQPVLFLALCIPVRGVERALADAAHVLLAAFDGIAAYAAAVPGAAPLVYPTVLAAVAGAVIAFAIVVACLAEQPARACLVAMTALAVMVASPLARTRSGMTELHMIDVGQGDALAIRTSRGQWIVVDAGRSWAGGDAGRSVVVPYIAHRGGRVALFVLSHPHADHVGGAASLFDALHPALFLDPGYVGTTPPYLAALMEARRDGIPWRRVHPGDSLVVDDAVITALAPDSAWAAGLTDANLASTVLLVRVGHVRLLLTGDAEGAEEAWLLAHGHEALRADVLKVAHHGSATSTTAAFLAAVRPRLALVSVGAHNSYGHPDAEVLERLGAAGVPALRTDLLGTVIVRTDGTRLEVEAHGERWWLPP